MKEFGIQIFSIRDHFGSIDGAKEAFLKLKEMGFSSIQTAGTYDGIKPEEFAKAAHDAGLIVCGTHYDWERICDDVEGTISYHQTLGTTNIGIGGMPAYARESLEGLKDFIFKFNEMADVYSKRGFKLTYHNHSFEFKKFENNKTLFDYLVEGLNPLTTSFVLDTYWVQHGGADIRATIERLNGRIDILHLKDMAACVPYELKDGTLLNAPAITEIGNGNINFKDIIPLAEKCGVKYFVIEDDRCPGPYGDSYVKTQKAADYIKANLLEK